MPSPRMSKSLEMIRSYKEHAPGDHHRRIERIAQMYERHEIPSRKVALHICSLLAASNEETRGQGILKYLKYAKPQLYKIFSPSDSEQDQQQDESSEDWIWEPVVG